MNFSFAQPQQQQQFQAGQKQQLFQQQQQPQINMQQQYNQANFMEHQKIMIEQVHLGSIKNSMINLRSLQNQPQLQFLLQTLINQQKVAKDNIQKTIQKKGIQTSKSLNHEQLLERGQKIKDKNTNLLVNVLATKAKLQRLMYHETQPNSKHEYEVQMAMDKIRSIKGNITQKIAHLKTSRVGRSNESKKRNRKQFSEVGTNLSEFKKGVQFLEREVLKNRTQMDFVVQYLNEIK